VKQALPTVRRVPVLPERRGLRATARRPRAPRGASSSGVATSATWAFAPATSRRPRVVTAAFSGSRAFGRLAAVPVVVQKYLCSFFASKTILFLAQHVLPFCFCLPLVSPRGSSIPVPSSRYCPSTPILCRARPAQAPRRSRLRVVPRPSAAIKTRAVARVALKTAGVVSRWTSVLIQTGGQRHQIARRRRMSRRASRTFKSARRNKPKKLGSIAEPDGGQPQRRAASRRCAVIEQITRMAETIADNSLGIAICTQGLFTSHSAEKPAPVLDGLTATRF